MFDALAFYFVVYAVIPGLIYIALILRVRTWPALPKWHRRGPRLAQITLRACEWFGAKSETVAMWSLLSSRSRSWPR